MGSTKGVHPSWRLATITIQTIPKVSCHQRAPLDAARRTSAVLNVVTAAVSLYVCRHIGDATLIAFFRAASARRGILQRFCRVELYFLRHFLRHPSSGLLRSASQ